MKLLRVCHRLSRFCLATAFGFLLLHFIDLLKLSKIEAAIEFGPAAVRGHDRKSIAQELWNLANKQFVPTSVVGLAPQGLSSLKNRGAQVRLHL